MKNMKFTNNIKFVIILSKTVKSLTTRLSDQKMITDHNNFSGGFVNGNTGKKDRRQC